MSSELLSPAGNFDCALAAFDAGADAVYCSLAEFSARAFADNFSLAELKDLIKVADKRGKKVYVAFNTLIDESDFPRAIESLSAIAECKPSALIVQDLGVARICREYFPSLELHASTQLVAHNLEGVLALGELGFKRVVLARELSLQEIVSIAKRCGDIELECFIHGALCYSISGLCLYSAMEKNRSGNRGKCAYCCRLPAAGKGKEEVFPFSMRDLRLGEDARKLVDASVASLKIEGRMKSHLYVAAVTAYYRAILNGDFAKAHSALADLESVFSRRTTSLYFNGANSEVIDSVSLGHFGTYVGRAKRITKDRRGREFLRFHTFRALECHDGLQIPRPGGGKPIGFGISEMRLAISRKPVFEVPADCDVEILLPEDEETVRDLRRAVASGADIYCSMSNFVKRKFPVPSFRASDYPGLEKLDVTVAIAPRKISAVASSDGLEVSAEIEGSFEAAKNPGKTYDAVEKAFSKLGDSDFHLGKLSLVDPDRLFAPASILNDLRRDLLEVLEDRRSQGRIERMQKALGDADEDLPEIDFSHFLQVLKIRLGQKMPQRKWDEVVVLVDGASESDDVERLYSSAESIRLALPVYTPEHEMPKLRLAVKRFIRLGYVKWEAASLAAVRLLKALGVDDITGDWPLYAYNLSALKEWTRLGIKRFVASPESSRENLRFLAESGFDVEFLLQQSTPLFISLTPPAALPSEESDLVSFEANGLWATTKRLPRLFDTVAGAPVRIDLSWSPE
ncbi:MAG: U32 family peptidase [Kiritimatiellae bacterium]|nr:U32 family peptidase [Kiritimatiellia bacterium]